jgi:hypothetical protein
MPSQHGVHTWLDDYLMDTWPEGYNAIAEFETLPEKLADLVILEGNLFDIDIEQIPTNRIAMTFFEGKQVYAAEG